MIVEKSSPDELLPQSPTRLRLMLQPGQATGLDSEEGRSVNLTCGDHAATLRVDTGEWDRFVGFYEQAFPKNLAKSKWQSLFLSSIVGGALAVGVGEVSQDFKAGDTHYRIVNGRVDARTYNGFRRYHAGCNHCHGPDGMGSTFAPPLVDRLPDIDTFRRTVLDGRSRGASVMKGFAGDSNLAPYVDDIYAYLRARADHYHALSIHPPKWAEGHLPLAFIENHVFYRLEA